MMACLFKVLLLLFVFCLETCSFSIRIHKRHLIKLLVSTGWKQTPDSEDGMRYAHDELSYRTRSGDVLQIPQEERYSTSDWLHNLQTLPSSRLLSRIKGVVIFNFIWSCIVYVAYTIFNFESPGSRCHQLLGNALGLLLVFRTNTAYERFWEGRKIWEKILTTLRNAGRMTVVCSDVIGVTKVERIVKLLSVFPVTLQEHVQSFVSPPELLKDFLTENDRQCLGRVTNRPLFILSKLSKEIRTIPDCSSFASAERMALQKHIEDLSATIGMCERIVQTPVPLTYARHTSRFLSLFCLSMPIALVGELHAYIIPFVSFVAWSLFGIQEIGMMIEEPFQRALKLEVFANTIRRDLSDLLHVSGVSSNPIEITSSYLKYQIPINRKANTTIGDTNKQMNVKEKATEEEHVRFEVSKLIKSDFTVDGNEDHSVIRNITDESTSTLISI